MAFDTEAILLKLQDHATAMVAPYSGMVYLGVPESLGARVTIYITAGGQNLVAKATGGFMQKEGRFVVHLAYRVRGAEQDAERQICRLIDDLYRRIARDPTLGGVVSRCEIDTATTIEATYAIAAGPEYRILPIVIFTAQQETIV